MSAGKTLFSQSMDFLPWSTFNRYVTRYSGDKGIRTLSRAKQFRVMVFTQLTYRESLRDIETCLSAQSARLYHMGFREPVRRATLADANESCDWRIDADFAARLIVQARKLYASEDLGLELSNTVFVLDSTTIDLCLSVFPWAYFRTTKAAVKMHTLLDLRGSIPSFIHVSNGKLHDVHVLYLLTPEPRPLGEFNNPHHAMAFPMPTHDLFSPFVQLRQCLMSCVFFVHAASAEIPSQSSIFIVPD